MRTRPLWADLVITALVFWAVLLPLEFAGNSAVIVAAVIADFVLLLLLIARSWRKQT